MNTSSLQTLLQAITQRAPEAAKTLKATIDSHGGIAGFLQAAKERVDREKLEAWLKDGKQLVMTNEQVQKLLGNEKVKQIAEKLGTTQEKVLEQVGAHLPTLLAKIEHAKAEAKKIIPEDGVLGKLVSQVKDRFFGGKPKV